MTQERQLEIGPTPKRTTTDGRRLDVVTAEHASRPNGTVGHVQAGLREVMVDDRCSIAGMQAVSRVVVLEASAAVSQPTARCVVGRSAESLPEFFGVTQIRSLARASCWLVRHARESAFAQYSCVVQSSLVEARHAFGADFGVAFLDVGARAGGAWLWFVHDGVSAPAGWAAVSGRQQRFLR